MQPAANKDLCFENEIWMCLKNVTFKALICPGKCYRAAKWSTRGGAGRGRGLGGLLWRGGLKCRHSRQVDSPGPGTGVAPAPLLQPSFLVRPGRSSHTASSPMAASTTWLSESQPCRRTHRISDDSDETLHAPRARDCLLGRGAASADEKGTVFGGLTAPYTHWASHLGVTRCPSCARSV